MTENFEITQQKDYDGIDYLKFTSTNQKLGLRMEIEPAISADGMNYVKDRVYVRFINLITGKAIDQDQIYEIGPEELPDIDTTSKEKLAETFSPHAAKFSEITYDQIPGQGSVYFRLLKNLFPTKEEK